MKLPFDPRRTLQLAFLKLGIGHVNFRWPQRSEALAAILSGGTRICQTPAEAYQLYVLARATSKLQGDMAELGVYRGGTARLICSASPNKTLHLFDTFAGLPEPGSIDVQFTRGTINAPLDEVQAYLRGCKVVFHAGMFPDTAMTVNDCRFCFVHLDADLYRSTLDALGFFYPRMVPGGVIASHDYVMAEGPRAAFDEFFAKRTDPVIEMSGNQCIVVKASSDIDATV